MDDLIGKISNSVKEVNDRFSADIAPITLIESHCSDGTSMGELIHSYSQRLVMVIWMLPAILGPVTGEVIILYMGLCNIPHYFIYHLLKYYIHELRPFNCGNPDYQSDFASPCFETMVSWNFTAFLITHTILRKMNKLKNLSKLNIRAIGRTLLIWSVFVTIGVVYTKNNTWSQSILGSLVGAVYGIGSATYLEFYWKDHIQFLVTMPPFSWMSYVDSVYNSIPKKCNCKRNNCRHKINKTFYKFISRGVYSGKHNSSSYSTYSDSFSSSPRSSIINLNSISSKTTLPQKNKLINISKPAVDDNIK